MILLHDNDITLRNWTMDDSQQLSIIANNKNIANTLTDSFPSPYTINDSKLFIERSINDKDNIFLAICLNSIVVGSIAIVFQKDIYRKTAIISYYVAEEYWNREIGSKAIKMLVEYVFDRYDIERISAEPFERNSGSRKALENAGFKLEGVLKNNVFKNNELQNSCIYARVRA